MKEADRKSSLLMCIAGTVATVVIALMCYANLFNTYLNDWHQAAGWGKYFSIPGFALTIVWLWRMTDFPWSERGAKSYGILAAIFLVLSIATACGFRFDL